MTKPTTEQLIRDFLNVENTENPMHFSFEIYRNIEGRLQGHDINHMSDTAIIRGYAIFWKLVRGNVTMIIATNDLDCDQNDAILFAAKFVEGKYSVSSIDLSCIGVNAISAEGLIFYPIKKSGINQSGEPK